jgi:hypothetical protein
LNNRFGEAKQKKFENLSNPDFYYAQKKHSEISEQSTQTGNENNGFELEWSNALLYSLEIKSHPKIYSLPVSTSLLSKGDSLKTSSVIEMYIREHSCNQL